MQIFHFIKLISWTNIVVILQIYLTTGISLTFWRCFMTWNPTLFNKSKLTLINRKKNHDTKVSFYHIYSWLWPQLFIILLCIIQTSQFIQQHELHSSSTNIQTRFLYFLYNKKEETKDDPQAKNQDLLLIRDLADCAKEDITINLVPKLLVFLLRSLVGLFDNSEVLH